MVAFSKETETTEKRVLLVEDSSVTQDLVELVLTQSGHMVVCADDGASALEVLAQETFDVVLMDFHLPDISGLEVVRRFLQDFADRPRPTFVAITADTRGLLADRENCEIFDRVIPKPLDIDLVVELVREDHASTRQPVSPMRRSAAASLGLALLEWPPGAGTAPAPGLPGIDAILLREARDLPSLWQLRGANLLPILDETGSLDASADIDLSTIAMHQIEGVRTLVDLFQDRRAELHPDLLRSADPADRLLARIHVAGGALSPRRSHRHDGLVAWNTICDPAEIESLLAKLRAEELVETAFFERVHSCPACQSSRLIVREECPACGSAHLAEESYLHHFRCACQAPERDFVRGDDLVCPKCRRELRHFGQDYDRPGIMTRCETCAATTADPQVAFVCARCDTRTSGEAMPTRDVSSARLTDAAVAYLHSGAAFLGPARRTLRFGDFPLELVIALNRAAGHYKESHRPFTLAAIQYARIDEVRARHGARRARDARRLWLETLQQELDDEALVVRGESGDFFLLPGLDPEAAQGPVFRARERADQAVRDDLGAAPRLFGPEDIAG